MMLLYRPVTVFHLPSGRACTCIPIISYRAKSCDEWPVLWEYPSPHNAVEHSLQQRATALMMLSAQAHDCVPPAVWPRLHVHHAEISRRLLWILPCFVVRLDSTWEVHPCVIAYHYGAVIDDHDALVPPLYLLLPSIWPCLHVHHAGHQHSKNLLVQTPARVPIKTGSLSDDAAHLR